MSRVGGFCNYCGACCLGNNGERCENLEVITAVGLPYASRCKVYGARYDGMPITMIAKDGTRVEGQYHCAKNSPPETAEIIKQIQAGRCSMRLIDG